ncbi:hypothetical protein PG996_013440 [Apiospora saccharicola]|uniref:Uncharacterized protein n=1 Tax=Apiospora saccharicola TaxID=335842 RepID=A0ABR1U874_9PEZI
MPAPPISRLDRSFITGLADKSMPRLQRLDEALRAGLEDPDTKYPGASLKLPWEYYDYRTTSDSSWSAKSSECISDIYSQYPAGADFLGHGVR